MPTAKAAPAAASDVLDAPLAAAAPSGLEEAIVEVRKWQSSLTLQGGIVAGAASFVAAKGGPLLIALGLSPALSGEAVSDVATLLGAAGALMVFIGRLRLGDLK